MHLSVAIPGGGGVTPGNPRVIYTVQRRLQIPLPKTKIV